MGLASQTFAAAPVPSNTGSYYSSSDCSNLYTQKYDSTFAMTIKGAYGFNSDSDMPNIGGGMLSLSTFIETEDLVHELSVTTGLLASENKTFTYGPLTLKAKYASIVPLLAGYTLNIPISSNSTHFFLGGKAGVTFSDVHASAQYGDVKISDSEKSTDFSFTVTAGFRFSITETADIILAYELLKIQDTDPYHLIELGVSWNF
jgi:opacity protein-like surface antigen